MRTFIINDNAEVRCFTRNRRRGDSTWGHEAQLFVNGERVKTAYIPYYNRTWESYQYRSVLNRILKKSGIMTCGEAEAYVSSQN